MYISVHIFLCSYVLVQLIRFFNVVLLGFKILHARKKTAMKYKAYKKSKMRIKSFAQSTKVIFAVYTKINHLNKKCFVFLFPSDYWYKCWTLKQSLCYRKRLTYIKKMSCEKTWTFWYNLNWDFIVILRICVEI